uniref:Uncharacterized protein n=1 Tax=Setaria italica TaxID=4555 RepID=K3YB40_SETIT
MSFLLARQRRKASEGFLQKRQGKPSVEYEENNCTVFDWSSSNEVMLIGKLKDFFPSWFFFLIVCTVNRCYRSSLFKRLLCSVITSRICWVLVFILVLFL